MNAASGGGERGMAMNLSVRQRRWLDALLMFGTIAVGLVAIQLLASVVLFFGDIILVFFLAWLIAFILTPIVTRLTNAIPLLPRVGAVVLVYTLLLGLLIFLAVFIANSLAGSIQDFVTNVPSIRTQLPEILAPWQRRLDALGLGQVNLVDQAQTFLGNLNRYAEQLAGPLSEVAVGTLGALGNLLIILILSLYMVIDRGRIVSFLFRLVPVGLKDEARLLETSVGRSFGGFLRGQAVMGLVYGSIAVLTCAVLNLPYLPVTSLLSGFLMSIPFFGPFVAWAPPVLVAIVTTPDATIPAIVIMGIGWLLVMNVLQPRLMADAVGVHPIVVLGSVLVGSKLAGIIGAIFGIPVGAVLSSFFFYYLGRSRESGPVATRAARRLAARSGRHVRVPREPEPGVDPDVVEPAPGTNAALDADTEVTPPRSAPDGRPRRADG